MPAELLYLLRILLAGVLSAVVGIEREFNHKAAGIRTHVLVGAGSALFMVVSKYGFADSGRFDASRVAAQIVSGIGFLGAGLIFVRRDAVRGLTTAASIWVVAGIAMAASAGLYLVAGGVTVIYLLFTAALRPLIRRLPHSRSAARTVRVTYPDGRGMLRTIMEKIGSNGVVVLDMEAHGVVSPASHDERDEVQRVEFQLLGSGSSMDALLLELNDIGGVSATPLTDTGWD
ncbi:MAG: MgtC/SapB family protein [Propionibacteriaceae bacterium]